ncbi:hypothetical protein E0765_00585 [Sulfuricurvum sp. IAE1]|uniref:CCE_0567 family metalloprotein n=1 Tax=Sulfuricurvum sp. IAE1 TaxID=2546102 RepID=UPI00104B5008|nr:CCE_0567 family metalloprotein [Sulfuricurvum sp. IAE1]MDD3769384.1 CCE_0567 family metalloprotein [Sulfuricurvum sp.]TDA68947.1 hypothetical protein E0765_00585 [Sulfuricurvum sp. IAE1]
MSEEIDPKKELAKLKRLATDVASQIHDIVEDTLWSDYVKMPDLAAQLYDAVKAANDYKKAHSL